MSPSPSALTANALLASFLGAPPALAWLGRVSPDAAILVATFGLLLIAWELNRPGMIVPGSAGLLAVLIAGAALVPHSLRLSGVLLLVCAVVVLAANLWARLPALALAAATLAMVVGLRYLVLSPPAGVHLWCALMCGGLLGGGAAVLSRIALRARRAKAVN